MMASRGLKILRLLQEKKDNKNASEDRKLDTPNFPKFEDAPKAASDLLATPDSAFLQMMTNGSDAPSIGDALAKNSDVLTYTPTQKVTKLTDVATSTSGSLTLYSNEIELGEYSVHTDGEVGLPQLYQNFEESFEVNNILNDHFDIGLNQDGHEITESLEVLGPTESEQVGASVEASTEKEMEAAPPEEPTDNQATN